VLAFFFIYRLRYLLEPQEEGVHIHRSNPDLGTGCFVGVQVQRDLHPEIQDPNVCGNTLEKGERASIACSRREGIRTGRSFS
jgi:hypothetical protein